MRAIIAMVRLAAVYSAALCVGAAVTTAHAQSSDLRSRVEPRLQFMVGEYHAAWQRAWRDSEEYRRFRISNELYGLRRTLLHCHPQYFDEAYRRRWNETDSVPVAYKSVIRGTHPAHWLCPRWLLTTELVDAADESVWRDFALRPQYRANIAAKRSRLLATLDSAQAADVRNAWLAGQLVRLRVADLDERGAARAAANCRTEGWWCPALRGLVQTRSGQYLAADSSFLGMRQAMGDSLRCEWDDVSELLEEVDRARFRSMSCAAREQLAGIIWWLADPLWREPGNARRAEQDARRTEIAVGRMAAQDERFSYDGLPGGEAVESLVLRYGWPTYRSWLGMAEEREHTNWLSYSENSPPSSPYSSLEYALDRIHTFPSWRAALNPFEAKPEDWRFVDEDSTGMPTATWWPTEHFRPARRLVQLPEGQTVSVRRQSYIEVVSAVTMGHPAQLRARDRYDVMLLASSGPERVDSLDQQWAASGDTVRLRGRLSGEPTLLGIEAVGQAADGLDARTRFGVSPPRPLSALAADEPAVSDLALLPPLSAAQLAAPSDTLLHLLRPSSMLTANDRRLSLYWESYNTRPSDSVQIVLRVVPENGASLLRRLGIAARLISDPTEGVEVRWLDSEPLGGQATLVGPVPAQMRAITLDLGRLKPGRYLIDLRMQRKDGRIAVQQTAVELLP